MDTLTATRTMPAMPSQRRGRELRRAILGALIRLAPPGAPRVSLAVLADRLDRRPTTISFHLSKLAADGRIDSRPGPGGGIVLTKAGVDEFHRTG